VILNQTILTNHDLQTFHNLYKTKTMKLFFLLITLIGICFSHFSEQKKPASPISVKQTQSYELVPGLLIN